jgi:hypothetical protein
MRLATLSAVVLALSACKGVQLKETAIPRAGDLTKKLDLQEIPYIRDDTFLGNPRALLGQVVEIRKKGGVCPTSFTGGEVEFAAVPVQGFEEDLSARLSSPAKRSSLVVNQSIAANVSFLSYLSAELETNSVFSLILIDEAAGRVKDQGGWSAALANWKRDNATVMADDNVCYVWVVRGFVQKNVIRRKFQEVKGGATGSAYGVNVGGKYYSGEDDYSVDVKFGLSPGILKRPTAAPGGFAITAADVSEAPTAAEAQALSKVQFIVHRAIPK